MGRIRYRQHEWHYDSSALDRPTYKWHINDGQEVFAVLDGQVQMKYRLDGAEHSTVIETGDIFYASVGTEHVAHPIGVARILVIETAGSI
jgi:mannose-6-phosphate isomerase-like protein (cupin superfamily)